MDGACGRTFGARSEMNGTLALWFEPHHPEAAASPPRLNLHVNVWKDISDSHNFLDLGFQFSDAADLGRFYLFFPVLFAVERVSDLSRIMKYSKTLSAVFNDVVEVAETADRFFKTEIDDRPHLTIHHIDDGDLAIEPVQMEDGSRGCTLQFTDALCRRLRDRPDEDHYLRVRFVLDGERSTLFSTEVRAGDWRFASASNVLELNEFRLNERRSFPRQITRASRDKFLNIRSIHYFLVRDVERQIVLQFPEARKVRQLEAALWGPYLDHRPGVKNGRVAKALPRLMIYHWRELAPKPSEAAPRRWFSKAEHVDEPGLEDFITFASFRRAKPNHLVYAVAIVILGGLGSLAASLPPVPGFASLTWLAWMPGWFARGVALILMLSGVYLLTVQPFRAAAASLRDLTRRRFQ